MSRPSTAALEIAQCISSSCALRNARLLNRRITQWYEEALRPIGLRSTQLTLLVAVGKMCEVRPSDLAAALAMEKSTLSRNTDRLLDRGWLQTHQAADGRAQVLSLSREGGKMLEKAMPLWQSAQEKAEEALGLAGMKSLSRLALKAYSVEES